MLSFLKAIKKNGGAFSTIQDKSGFKDSSSVSSVCFMSLSKALAKQPL